MPFCRALPYENLSLRFRHVGNLGRCSTIRSDARRSHGRSHLKTWRSSFPTLCGWSGGTPRLSRSRLRNLGQALVDVMQRSIGVCVRKRLKPGKYGPLEHQQVFWASVQKTATCWLWIGPTVPPWHYGQFWTGRAIYAHRFSYELHKGVIPVGLTIDHLCRNPRCVNPDHLEAVTMRENLLRGRTVTARNAARTHCNAGHPFDAENIYWIRGYRMCKTCHLARTRQRREVA